MAESKYIAIIKAQLEQADIQAQLNQLQSKMKPIKVKIQTNVADVDKLNISTGKMQNQLDAIRIRNKDAYKTQPVQDMDKKVQGLINSYDGSKKAMGEFQVANGQLKNKVLETNGALSTATQSTDNFGTALIKDIGKMVQWAVAGTLIYGTLKQIGDGIQYIKDLDKELTNIGMVTGQTQERLVGMASGFNNMAKQLGVSTLDVAKGATEWIRQGKTAAETTELLRSSTMMSKLGNLEAADATDKLIAVTNAYNISAKDSIDVVSTLVALDNSFATSTAEISEGMQKSASMAKLAGVSYKDLASYITVISATTRQSGETIGQAMKTIFARMEQVKAGAKIDEEGEAINNVEKVLLKNGIALRDNANQFRDMSDVLQDVAVRYQQLGISGDTVAQQQIVGAIAGK
jgi:TP901 family phage tail tape measure protein